MNSGVSTHQSETMSTCRRLVISGRVQGVCYRVATQARAGQLGLTGWVRNRSDGSVEVLACGAEHTLDRLLDWLWIGPQMAQVTGVKTEVTKTQAYPGFTIR